MTCAHAVLAAPSRRFVTQGGVVGRAFLNNRRPSSASLRQRRSYARILGIETSCDDTGVAIVDTDGAVLAEALYGQGEFHAQLGGVIPPIARELHAANVVKATDDVLRESGLRPSDLSAVAVTTRPGLVMTLYEGLEHARKFALASRLPLLPIHHMEAHALTPRMAYPDLSFPFLVLLVSGGHCILSLVRGVSDFLVLGNTIDVAPGELFDKAGRRLKLRNLAECRRLGFGPAIESVAKGGDPTRFTLPHPLLRRPDCNFSFGGLRTAVQSLVEREETRCGVFGGDVLPTAADIAAGLQVAVAKHLAVRLVRAWNYCDLKELVPAEGRTRRALVMSGGVAANGFLRSVVERVCERHDARLVCPPPKLCTDNGVMIAWNGAERWKVGDRGMTDEVEMMRIEPVDRTPLGEDVGEDVIRRGLKVKSKDIDALVDSVIKSGRRESPQSLSEGG